MNICACSNISCCSCFFVLSIINIAQAATAYSFSAACPSVSDQVIVSHHVDNNDHLFLPGSWDPSAICFSFAKPSQTITIGDLSVNSGDLLDLSGFLGEKLPMKAADGFQMGSLTVWQGSSIPSLFVQVDAEGLKAIRRSKNNEITEGTACCAASSPLEWKTWRPTCCLQRIDRRHTACRSHGKCSLTPPNALTIFLQCFILNMYAVFRMSNVLIDCKEVCIYEKARCAGCHGRRGRNPR